VNGKPRGTNWNPRSFWLPETGAVLKWEVTEEIQKLGAPNTALEALCFGQLLRFA
jgi:hypothetical protein